MAFILFFLVSSLGYNFYDKLRCHARAARLSWHFRRRIMAKQKHGHSDYTNSPRSQRRQRHQQHSPSLVYPSSSVLSILATIAASSHTVDGSPLPLPTPPPPFLCPSINYDSFQPHAPTPTTASSSSIFYSTSSLSSSSLPGSTSNRQVADKYVQGVDGLWRKTDSWTLFGSSVSFFLVIIEALA